MKRANLLCELFGHIKASVGSDETAVAILQVMQKDLRAEFVNGHRQRKSGGVDEPATEKQVNYLERLGVAVPEGVTKAVARKLIDAALGK